MAKAQPNRVELLQGTLDMLILRTLLLAHARPRHRQAYSAHFRRSFAGGARLPLSALHRLDRQGWITSKWATDRPRPRDEVLPADRRGRRQLTLEESKWKQLARAMRG